MLVMTAKITRKKMVAGVIAFGLAICALILIKGGAYESSRTAADAEIKISTDGIKTAEDRVLLLEGFGWKIQSEPIEFMEVQIPEEFDEVYSQYNDIQLQQGMDLKKYAGKRAMRYSYQVMNYPTGENGVIANILVYKNRLIAGDVCSPQLNGFMHGLSMPIK